MEMEWINERITKWMNGWMYEWMNVWMNVWINEIIAWQLQKKYNLRGKQNFIAIKQDKFLHLKFILMIQTFNRGTRSIIAYLIQVIISN